MSDVFAYYGRRATTTATPRLVGPMATRKLAKQRYVAIVGDLTACGTASEVRACLARHAADITQFRAELEFLWAGDGDFRGLEKEIAWATARVDERLDFPRWEPAETQEGTGQ